MEAASITEFSALFSTETFPNPDQAEVNVQEFINWLSNANGERLKPGIKEIGKSSKEQRLFQIDVLLCAGLCLGEETIRIKTRNGPSEPIQNPKQIVEDLLTSHFGEPSGAREVMKNRFKLNKVKEDCCRLRDPLSPEHGALRPRLDSKLKQAEKNRMSKCECTSRKKIKCMEIWKKIYTELRKVGQYSSSEEQNETTHLIECMNVEVIGFHFYMTFRHLRSALDRSSSLYRNKNNKFEFVLDACEEAYARLEDTLLQIPKYYSKRGPIVPPRGKRADKAPKVLQGRREELARQGESQSRLQNEERRRLEANNASLTMQLKQEKSARAELRARLSELETKLKDREEIDRETYDEDTEKFLLELRTDRDKLASQLENEREWRHREQKDADREIEQRTNEIQSLEKKIEDMQERHRVESNRLKTEDALRAAELKRLQEKLYADAQKRVAKNSQVEQLSDRNRPSKVASRYEDLFQRTYDVAEILEEVKNIDEDESNNFIVQILMTSRRAAEVKLSEYLVTNAKTNGLKESFLEENPTAQRVLKDSVTGLLRLASAEKKEENSKSITEIAMREIELSYEKYYSQETAPAIEKFLMLTSPIVWEVAIFADEAEFVLGDTTFDEALHERFGCSNPNSDKITSVVWPRLTQRFTNKTLCKGKVVTAL